MPALAEQPELVGFFSYSREDDADSKGGLSALRDRIQRELRGQLGRSPRDFRLWQDREAIAPGTLWESAIRAAVDQSVFFIPIITPTSVRSAFCQFEFEAFLTREQTLGRKDLIFPILYIRVPGLEDGFRSKDEPILSMIAERQYVDWREFRHRDVYATQVSEAIERLCSKIAEALNRPDPAEAEAARRRQAEVDQLRRRESERQRQERARRTADADHQRRDDERRRQQESADATQRTGGAGQAANRQAPLLERYKVAERAAAARTAIVANISVAQRALGQVWRTQSARTAALASRMSAKLSAIGARASAQASALRDKVRGLNRKTVVLASVGAAVVLALVVAGGIWIQALRQQAALAPRTLTGHANRVEAVAFSSAGQALASGSADNTIKLWDAASGKLLRTLTGHLDAVDAVAFWPGGKALASGSWDDTVKLWDATSGQLLGTLTGHTDVVGSVAISPDGRSLASGSWDHTIKLWDASSGQLLRTLTGHTNLVNSVVFLPDGRTLASGSSDRTIGLWDTTTGQLLRTLTGHTDVVDSVAVSPDGRMLGSGSWDNTIKLWDVATARLLRTLTGHANRVESVAFSPDGRTLASASWDDTIKLWDTASGQLLRTLNGHANAVESVAFSADGRTLAAGFDDKTIKLWNVANDNPPSR